MIYNKLTALLLCTICFSLNAQRIGIGVLDPQASLDINGDLSFIPKTTHAVKLLGLSLNGMAKEYPLSPEFTFTDGVLEISPSLEDNQILVGSHDQSTDGNTTGIYHNYDIGLSDSNAENGIIRLTGETTGYTITGFADGVPGRTIYIYNAQNVNVTFMHLNTGSNPENQLILEGASENINAQGVAEFVYDGFLEKWVLINLRS
jgi:hypothetical protein